MIFLICLAVLIILLICLKKIRYYNLNKNGVKYLNSKEYESAMNCFDSAIKLNTKSSIAYHNKADLLMREGKMDESLKYCLKIIELKPTHCFSYARIMLYYVKLKDYNSILKYSAKSHSAKPKAVSLYLYRAYAYIHKEDYTRAEKSINKILSSSKAKLVEDINLKSILNNYEFTSGFYAVAAIMKLLQKNYDEVYINLSKLPFEEYNYDNFLKSELFISLRNESKFQNIVKECEERNADKL